MTTESAIVSREIVKETSLPEDLESEFSSFGNARRMLKMHGGFILYNHTSTSWMIWKPNLGKWVVDNDGRVPELVKEMIRKIKIEASDLYFQSENTEDEEEGKRLRKRANALMRWWNACQQPKQVNNCLEILKTDPAIAVTNGEFDINSDLFNFENGTLDVGKMEFYPHRKEDRITMSCGHGYDPDAKCPNWDKFVDRIFLNHPEKTDLIRYLQCALGTSLTGDTSDQKIYMPVGTGGNGKSVLMETMKLAYGQYGFSIASQTLTLDSRNKIRNDIARLRGCRIVFASEAPLGSHLDDQLLKNLSGGDHITVRFLYQEEFEFKPQLKLWWSFNRTPQTRDLSPGLWDRIRTIPFLERIRGTSEDIPMPELLKTYREEMSGILNWLIDGFKDHKKIGKLPLCAAVMARVEEYQHECDQLYQFSEECFDVWNPAEHLGQGTPREYAVKAIDAFNAYNYHARQNGVRLPLTGTGFGLRMKEKFGRENVVRREDGYYYNGVKLKPGVKTDWRGID